MHGPIVPPPAQGPTVLPCRRSTSSLDQVARLREGILQDTRGHCLVSPFHPNKVPFKRAEPGNVGRRKMAIAAELSHPRMTMTKRMIPAKIVTRRARPMQNAGNRQASL